MMTGDQTTRRGVVAGGLSATTALLLGLPHRIAAQTAAPDMVVFNARVTTMERARPDATAFALRGDSFVAVGTDAEILPLAGPATRRVDAGGRRVVPGLNDSHTHTVRGGLNYALELRWDGIPTFAEAMARLRDTVARTPPGQWVRVVGGYSPGSSATSGATPPRRAERDRARHAGLRAEPLCRRLPQPRRAARAEHHARHAGQCLARGHDRARAGPPADRAAARQPLRADPVRHALQGTAASTTRPRWSRRGTSCGSSTGSASPPRSIAAAATRPGRTITA
jgi:hypothetical protein